MDDKNMPFFAAAHGSLSIKANAIMDNQAVLLDMLTIIAMRDVEEGSTAELAIEKRTQQFKDNLTTAKTAIDKLMKECGV